MIGDCPLSGVTEAGSQKGLGPPDFADIEKKTEAEIDALLAEAPTPIFGASAASAYY